MNPTPIFKLIFDSAIILGLIVAYYLTARVPAAILAILFFLHVMFRVFGRDQRVRNIDAEDQKNIGWVEGGLRLVALTYIVTTIL